MLINFEWGGDGGGAEEEEDGRGEGLIIMELKEIGEYI